MNKLILGLFSFLFFFSISSSPSLSAKRAIYIEGKIKVIDGDTIKMDGTRIRLFGIDAPEKNQICVNKNSESYNCGSISTKILKNMLEEKKSNVVIWKKTDTVEF